jgi:drug/metabolite transporter (DMT)-like permease
VVVPVAVGLARGERPSTLQDVGVGLAIVGVLVAAREPVGARTSRVAAGVGLALGAAAAIGVVLVALDAASEGDALWSSLSLRVTTFSVFVLAGLVLRPSLAVGRGELLPLAAIGILDTAGNALFALATSRGLLTLVSPLGQLYPIVTVLLARLLLGERVSRAQRLGVAVALAGVGLVTVG